MFHMLISILLLNLSIVRCELICCPDLDCMSTDPPFDHLPAPRCPRDLNMYFGLFTRDNKLEYQEFNHESSIPDLYRSSKPTVFILHGYQNSIYSGSMLDIKDALLEKEDLNIILVCWKELADSIWYPNSASNTRTVGAETAFLINRMKDEVGLTTDQIWCIGYSLGSHGCAFTGQRTQMGRLTALDPAGPWFDGQEIDARLSKDDADLVDVIHTDGWGVTGIYYGMLTPVGDIDFYPNGGYKQPGCITYTSDNSTGDNESVDTYAWNCSHGRGPKFFLNSILQPNCFTTQHKCSDHKYCQKTKEVGCSGSSCPEMGYNADRVSGANGLYYLETTRSDPYCA